ncbi:uncharacterized protein At5g39865 [Malania oleifera]|uniref:uncharacterized protein At5g39865 n=1 Tax=Malania oleifera TaxID=397392 RepID=UPI0025AE666C|nr:uncharacterized protein At5g39865 [Malania oleifera]
MAEHESSYEISSKLSRSLTVHSTPNLEFDPPKKPSLDRSQSIKKLRSSFETFIPNSNSIKGKVKRLCSIFESAKSQPPAADESPPQSTASKLNGSDSRVSSLLSNWITLPGTEDRIVLYFTSLRGIRRTYADCYAVRTIFRGFRLWVDERDISMDSAYRTELQNVLGEKRVSLPQVFIRGKYLGGAEVVKQLHEVGELAKLLDGFPVREPGSVCDSCGDARFLPCTNCNGSRKVYEEDEGVLKRCLECNENGLIRCPDCCS